MVLKDAEEFVYIGTWITGYRLERPAISQETTHEEEQVAGWLVARAVTPAPLLGAEYFSVEIWP